MSERPRGLRILRSAMTPLCNEDGSKRQFGPYEPVIGACDVCPARCCRLNVKVSLPDALELCRVLGVPFFAPLSLVPSTAERAFLLDHDPRLEPAVPAVEWTGRAEIQLRRKDDGSCGFLVPIGGYDRCGIYSVRPSTCRLYPLSWDADTARGAPALILCPVPYGVTPTMEEAFYADAARSIERWEVHDRVLAEWHDLDSPRSVEAFLGFALPRTAALLDEPLGATLEPGTPFDRLRAAMLRSGVVR